VTSATALKLLIAVKDLPQKRGPLYVDKTPVLKAALWVGGPPGQTLHKIRGRLRKDGIDLREQSEVAVKPPSWCELVLINRDMVSHTNNDRQKQFCRDADIPFIFASLSYVITRRNLERGGHVNPTVSIVTDDEPADTTPATENSPMSINPDADLETQKASLRTFLLGLPPELRRIALRTNDEMLVMEEDDILDKALVPLQPLLNNITDEGLLRGLRRTLNKETRQRIHTALGLIDI
jgi:hypothetical protein